jgi:hypothetical protein
LRAINEELDKRFRSDAVIGRHVLMEIALDKEHPQRLKAATALLDRGGFHSMSEQRISVTHTDLTSEGMIERIKMLATELGMDPAKLIGHSNGAATVTIEAEAVETEAVTAPARPAPRVSRYVARTMVQEYQRVGWQAPHGPEQDGDDRDMIEMIWPGESEPRLPDRRPMSAG